ncbi:nuclear transport factor 2 family protein [Streptomyces sp. NPDC044780]|uniref:Nuclear transport factor 2 family protein n=1 Tax=Streptomyces luomodiensis TaxID=3026192 RepID=A0ABY9VC72_9ACTN|nr:nuclear transport factor 2 family protein [Streptomyces sp. SCA4-21]WNF01224.1 nuclear transport factor 2 family protein [Streptomyces sp. SCA4-21]
MTDTTDTMDTTPVGVFNRCMELLLVNDIPTFLTLIHPDAVMEFPFTPPGRPRRIEGGEAVREYFMNYSRMMGTSEVTDLTVHETKDPEVLVIEFAGTSTATATGEQVDLAFVSVLRVRDGLVLHYRDYWNPLTTLALMNEAPPGAEV